MNEIQSAGGLVTKKENNQIKICLVELVHVNKGFIFPKGHIENGESLEEAALRETKEELGLQGLAVVKKLGSYNREGVERDGTKVIKHIHIYLLKTDNFKHTDSDEKYSWLTYDDAMQKMEFEVEKEFLKTHWNEVI